MSTGEAAAAPREHGWALYLSALASFLLLPATPVLQILAPVTQPLILVLPMLAVCALVGWAAGGHWWVALAWVALAAWAVLLAPGPPGASTAYVSLERGWAVLLAAGFGLVSMAVASEVRLFSRALVAIVIAGVLAIGAFAGSPLPASTVMRTIDRDIARRSALAQSAWSQTTAMPQYKSMSGTISDPAERVEFERAGQSMMVDMPTREGRRFFPALLGLESLCALALGWALYHRLSRTRIGLPLARLRDFRFNDQLVWGVIVGAVFLVTPHLGAWRTVGANLTLFFGTLYAVRGMGVLAWFLRSVKLGVLTLIAVALLAGMLAPALALGLGLIGLGDTWEDWRAKARPTT